MSELEMASTSRLGSDALHQMFQLVDELRADAIRAALDKRGCKTARTRVRVKLGKIASLCRQARKDIKPVGHGSNPQEE